jgi:N-acetylmuramoyl-L-alanine amidase
VIKLAQTGSSSKSQAVSSYPLPSGVIKVTDRKRRPPHDFLLLYRDKNKERIKRFALVLRSPQTANAVKRFQSVSGLTADGIYGPKTKAKIEEKL